MSIALTFCSRKQQQLQTVDALAGVRRNFKVQLIDLLFGLGIAIPDAVAVFEKGSQ